MLRRSRILSLLLLCLLLRARATDYSDIWWNPDTEDWLGSQPRAERAISSSRRSSYTGQDNTADLVRRQPDAPTRTAITTAACTQTTGHLLRRAVESGAEFRRRAGRHCDRSQPTRRLHGTTSVYRQRRPDSVAKTIQRQTLTPITLGGTYSGTRASSAKRTALSAGAYKDYYDLQRHAGDGDGSADVQPSRTRQRLESARCRAHSSRSGQLYRIPNCELQVYGRPIDRRRAVDEIKATSLGIEGAFRRAERRRRLSRRRARFSAVFWHLAAADVTRLPANASRRRALPHALETGTPPRRRRR